MNKNLRHIGIRVTEETHYKLTYISQFHSRSLANLCVYVLERYIKTFEKKYGNIELPAYIKDEK